MRAIKTTTEVFRQDSDAPPAIEKWGWKYHHIGIPTQSAFEGERHLPAFKFYTSGFPTSPFGIEWMRFEPDSPIDKLIQTVPHIAFEVENIDIELAKREFQILTPPNAPVEGTRVAMIVHNGAPIELIQFNKLS